MRERERERERDFNRSKLKNLFISGVTLTPKLCRQQVASMI